MKHNRRKFLKQISLVGFGLTGVSKLAGADKAGIREPFLQVSRQRFNMHNYAAPSMGTVRIGFIGVGSRGSGTMSRFARIDGVEVKAVCDIVPGRVRSAIERIEEFSHNPDSYSGDENEWKKICERDDIDLVIISTPWHLHAPQAIYTMENGKHVGVEVPAAATIRECWQLVETSERTRKHCMMLANSAYGPFNILTLNMARQGFFGEIIHGEGAYIHDRVSGANRWRRDEENAGWFGYRPWRLDENIGRNGNLYPTHGLGSVCQVMNLNYGDRMDYLVSVSGDDFTMGPLMEELAAEDDYFKPYVGQKFRGNMNVTIIRTLKGRTIMLQHDISSPRPNVRYNLISGTKGIARQTPAPARIATSHDGWLPQEEYDALAEEYNPEINKRVGEISREIGGHGGVDTMMAWRMIDCLRNGLPLDMNVYDAALWSSVVPLTEWSVANRSNSVSVPDFTSGAWETNKPNMDIELKQGGTIRIL
jgi:hypothetical protein